MKQYTPFSNVDVSMVNFSLGQDRNGKTTVIMTLTPNNTEVALVSAPAITMWPRCTGDGNFGTMWGPSDLMKAKFTLDLTDQPINEQPNEQFTMFAAFMDAIDDRLLEFVTANQLRILGRKNLCKEEVKMLQIRSVRPKYDKVSGALNGYVINLSCPKYASDGMGGKYARTIAVCDYKGVTVPNGQVAPGDVVAATMFANQVYTGVGGDKFGIHWQFEDVSVICQRAHLQQKAEVNAFMEQDWEFARPYVDQSSESYNSRPYDASQQFGVEAAA